MRLYRDSSISVVLLAGLAICPGCATYTVYKGLQPDKFGIVYRLPRKVLVVTVPLIKVEYSKGTLFDHARNVDLKFKGLPLVEPPVGFDPLNSNPFRFGVPAVSEEVEPDPGQVYFVEIQGSALEDRTLTAELSAIGCWTSGTIIVKDRRPEHAVAWVKFASKLASAVGGMHRAVPKPSDGEGQAIAFRTDLKEIRATRYKILADASSYSEERMQETLGRLQAMEDRISSQFYEETIVSYNMVFHITPDFSKEDPTLKGGYLLLLDKKKGVELGGLAAEAAFVETVPIPKVFSVTPTDDLEAIYFRVLRNEAFDVSAKQITKLAKNETGFVYRIPGAATVIVEKMDVDRTTGKPAKRKTTSATRQYTQTVIMPQAGSIASLPPIPGTNTDFTFNLSLHEDTGAIKTVDAQSRAIDPAMITDLGTVLATDIERLSGTGTSGEEADSKSQISNVNERLTEFRALLETARSLGIPVPSLPVPVADGSGEDAIE